MDKKIVLQSLKREKNEDLKTLRSSKNLPAVVYGKKQPAISLKLGASETLKAFRVAGVNHIVSLDIEGKKIDVLFHEVQKHPVTGDIIHVDFLAIAAGEKITSLIPLVFVGNSKAKSDEGAIIEEVLKQIEVKCLATDLVDNFEVDLSKLEKSGDNIKVSDLNISSKYELLTNKEEVVAVAVKSKEEVVSNEAPESNLPEDPKAKAE